MALISCSECGHQISDQARTCPNCGFEQLSKPVPSMPSMEDKIYYNDPQVTVTQSRFVTTGKTYAMRNISSVQMGTIPPNVGGHWLIILFGVVLVILAPIIGKVIGVAIVVLVYLSIKKVKPQYTVRINSNSGEVDGLVSTDKEYIQKIINGINEAIISH